MSEDGKGGRIPLIPKLVLTLTVAGLLSGLTLVTAYQVTLPTIEANKAAALRRAVFKVLPGSAAMQRMVARDGRLAVSEEKVAGELAIYAAYDSTGGFVGYAIPSEGAGFQDVIQILYGYRPDERMIVGMEVLQSRETPGLGDKIFKDMDFVNNFKDLAVDPEVVLTKEGRQNPNEVDAITGATISSNAVVRIIGAGNAYWFPLLSEPGQEPPLQAPPAADGSTARASTDTKGGGA